MVSGRWCYLRIFLETRAIWKQELGIERRVQTYLVKCCHRNADIEQKIDIKFFFKLGKSATETREILKKVYGENALARSRTFECLNVFGTAAKVLKMTLFK